MHWPIGCVAAEPAKVDFARQIQPILEKNCLQCHSRGKYKGGLSLETRQSLLAGGESGPAAIVGKPEDSLLLDLVNGQDPDRIMPAKGPRLAANQIALLRAWIDQGLVWPTEIGFGFPQAALAPRRPQVPPAAPGSSLTNPIDLILQPYIRDHRIPKAEVVSDRVFARRVYLDLVGLLPSVAQLAEFERDARPDKRARLVGSLLGDQRAYADHWLTFWNDLLRNAYRGTGFIDGGREQITDWLYQSLYDNLPYDQFVHQLISPVPGSSGFTKGIVWRGVVNASQTPPVQAAQNISQVFLGTNLKCASCHDSFVNHWKLTESYSLAAVFAEGPLEIHRCDKPTGKMAQVGFIYPQLGTIDAAAPRAARMKQLADLLVKPENGRLSRTIVNRLWAQLLGRGIVEPVDDLDQIPWNADLLDWLASDLVDHGYDSKHTLALICTSQAYQRAAAGLPKPGEDSGPFTGPLVKRMSAEQFVDAVCALAGVTDQARPAAVKPRSREVPVAGGAQAVGPVTAQWIWSHDKALSSDPGGSILLRKVLTLTAKPTKAPAILTCDNELKLFVNGKQVAQSENWQQPVVIDLAPSLIVGDNVLAIEATNWPDVENNRGVSFKGANPAAAIFYAIGFEGDSVAWTLGSDATWLWAKRAEPAWTTQPFDTSGWQHAAELGKSGAAYQGLNLEERVKQLVQGPTPAGPVRSSLGNDDALLRMLGRSNREQVVTRRESIGTTLQALELTNGEVLDKLLKQGADTWLAGQGADGNKLIDAIFMTALARLPVAAEREVALSVIGSPPNREGLADLLWAVLMLPEFQLIY